MKRREGLNVEQILALTKRNQYFHVSKYSYRDANLRKKLKRLVRDGKLYLADADRDSKYYALCDSV